MRAIVALLVGASVSTLPSAVHAQEPAASHVEATEELLRLTRVEEFMTESMNSMVQMQLEANPQLQPFEQVFHQFFGKHMSWDVLKNDFVELYTRHFTEAEIRSLADFYRTDLGRKAVSLQQVLFHEGARIGQRRVMANADELQAMIMERAQELQNPQP